MRRLFEGGLFWKLDTRKNCINYGNTIFRMKLTELASWFWFYRDRDAHVNFLVPIAVLIRGRRKIREGAYSSKYGNSHVTACYRMLPRWVKPGKICRWTQKRHVNVEIQEPWEILENTIRFLWKLKTDVQNLGNATLIGTQQGANCSRVSLKN